MLKSSSAASPLTQADAPSHERGGAHTPAPSRSGRIRPGRLCASSNGHGYVPLDELLASPKVRVLRLLRRHDSASSHEIHEVLEIQREEIDTYNQVISRLFREGLTARVGKAVGSYRYSLTALGRERLARILARADISTFAMPGDELAGAA